MTRFQPGSLLDPDGAEVAAALGWSCDVCKVPAGQLCRNSIDPRKPLAGRLVHFARLHDRRREPKDDS